MDDYLLRKIFGYLMRDLYTNKFGEIKHTVRSLMLVNRRFSKILNLDAIRDHMSSRITEINFWPYQRSISYDMLQTVRHDLDMINYIVRWRSCKSCKKSMINFLINSEKVINPLTPIILFKDFNLLFCPNHYHDMNTRRRLDFWHKIILQIIPESTEKPIFMIKLQIIVDKCTRWC